MRVSRLLFSFLLLAASAWPAGAASSSADAPHVHVQLVLPRANLAQGASNPAGLYFKLDPGWHVYWKNAGDAGEPPHLRWTLPEGITAGPLQFPAPKRLPLGPLMDFGYEDEVLYPFEVQVAQGAKPGAAVLHAKADWLVCQDRCIPGKAELEVTATVLDHLLKGVPAPGADAALFNRLIGRLPQMQPAGMKAVFASGKEGFTLSVESGQRETEGVFFPAEQDLVENPAPQKVTPTAKGLLLELKKSTNISANPAELKGVLEFSGGRAFELEARPGAVAAAAPPLLWKELARSAGLAFLGGLILNLMPCVFPVLFLKGLSLVNSGNEERRQLRVHGVVYTAGILVSFWALVAVLLILRAAGSTLGWGFQFQSPVFLALMAGLLFFLGLSLAGQFEIGLTLTSAGGSLAAKQGYSGSFFTGVLAVVVATPCTAPFMGVAVGYALAQAPAVTFVIFTALALGLAAPYAALTLQPAWTKLLPRPGVWMEVLRQAVSVPIFATVIWLAWVLAQAYGAGVLAGLLASFLLLAVAGWFLGRWPARRWASGVAAVIVLAVVGIAVFGPKYLGAMGARPAQAVAAGGQAGSHWEAWTADAVSRYQTQGRPVFVDFTASWCLSCQVNALVLDKPEVQRAFESGNVVMLKADWTQHDDAITQTLAGLGRSGVPAYALYPAGGGDPEILPEVLTEGILADALGRLGHPAGQAGVR